MAKKPTKPSLKEACIKDLEYRIIIFSYIWPFLAIFVLGMLFAIFYLGRIDQLDSMPWAILFILITATIVTFFYYGWTRKRE
jgi:hypothetical protein